MTCGMPVDAGTVWVWDSCCRHIRLFYSYTGCWYLVIMLQMKCL